MNKEEFVEDCMDTVLNTFGGLSRDVKLTYLKKLINMCSIDELGPVKKFASRSRTRLRSVELPVALDLPVQIPQPGPSRAVQPIERWWLKFQQTECIALDCEFARKKNSKIIELATIAIVNTKLDIVYEARVYWQPHSLSSFFHCRSIYKKIKWV